MAKFKVGQVVKHIGTGDKLLILHIRAEEVLATSKVPVIYVVRLPNYQRADIEEFELEAIKVDGKIEG